MYIRSKLLRAGGTKIHIAGQELHFRPNDKGDHVCFIADEAIRTHLTVRIPEGYEVYADQELPKQRPITQAVSAAIAADPNTLPHLLPGSLPTTTTGVEPVAIYGSDKFDAIIKIGGKDVQLGTIVAAAFDKFGGKVQDWNEQRPEDRDLLIGQALQAMQIAAAPPPGEHSQPAVTATPLMNGEPGQGQSTAPPPSDKPLAPELQQGAGQGPLANKAEGTSATAAEASPAKLPKVPKKMVITNGSESIDLMKLEYDAVKKLAVEQFGITVHKKWPVQTIRDKIVEATRASGV